MKAVPFALMSLLVLAVPPVVAGQFTTTCFSDLPTCSGLVNDLVTDKFTEAYPADAWEIVILAETHRYETGGAVSYAVVGVARRQPANAKGDSPSLVPEYRFTSTTRSNDDSKQVTADAARTMTRDTIRSAVSDMMAACAEKPKCDLLR